MYKVKFSGLEWEIANLLVALGLGRGFFVVQWGWFPFWQVGLELCGAHGRRIPLQRCAELRNVLTPWCSSGCYTCSTVMDRAVVICDLLVQSIPMEFGWSFSRSARRVRMELAGAFARSSVIVAFMTFLWWSDNLKLTHSSFLDNQNMMLLKAVLGVGK